MRERPGLLFWAAVAVVVLGVQVQKDLRAVVAGLELRRF